MRLFSFLNLRGIGGQIAALVLASMVGLQLVITATFLFHRPDRPEAGGEDGAAQLASAAQLLGTAPAAERSRLLADFARAYPQLDIRNVAAEAIPATAGERLSPYHHLRRLGRSYRIVPLAPPGDHNFRIGVVLPDGSAISASLPADRPPPPLWRSPWMTTLMFAVVSVTLLGLWAARTLTRPLSSFARAAESFSIDRDAAPLPERGPEEVRSLAKALNRMRKRITELIDDRTRMLAAISHDLRTPITRMRLRSEFIEDEIQRSRMLADLDQMRSMLESVLSFLRDGRKLEQMTLVDIASTLQLVADQFADMGHKVAYAGPGHAMATARPDDLLRTVTNIVENAVRFGGEVTIRLTVAADCMTVDVEDDGPGISDGEKGDMLEPFVRGDDARNMDDATGFGLGLSIARAIVTAHGGKLSLHDRQPSGLMVRMELPVRQQGQRAAA
jgi:signal transduction histidine kinase